MAKNKVEKISTGEAVKKTVINWIEFILFATLAGRFGAGNLSRFVNWNKNKMPHDLDKQPYSKPGKAYWAKGGTGADPTAGARDMTSFAMKNPKLTKNLAGAAFKRMRGGNTESGFGFSVHKHDIPYSLINGDPISDWLGRNIAWSFAMQRKLYHTIVDFIGSFLYGNNFMNKSPDYLYITNLFHVLIVSWILFWFIFGGQLLFGNLITIWGASVFGGWINSAWGDVNFFDFDFSARGGSLKAILHFTPLCFIFWLLFFCLELPIISIVQSLMLLLFFWSYSYNEGSKEHWKLLFKYPRILFYLVLIFGSISALVNLSGEHLAQPKEAEPIMYLWIIVSMILIGLSEWGVQSQKKKNNK